MTTLNSTDNMMVIDALTKSQSVLAKYDKVQCSISGGSDSDIVLDIVERTKGDTEVKYVFFDTGLEYKATKDHLEYLEQRYGIEIDRVKAYKSIPYCCKTYGQPFLSKFVSEMMGRLQSVGFQWEDKPTEELIAKYPNVMNPIRWWNNNNNINEGWETSRFNINHNRYLREFILLNPPPFRISNQCCEYAKKKTAHRYKKSLNAPLDIVGVRKAEDGIRASVIKNCYDQDKGVYRPVFWLSDKDKKDYEDKFGIVHSECYTKYGFKRTGCSCCPYALNLEQELSAIEIYEPMLYKACNKVFKETYEYTRQFRAFQKEMRKKEKNQGQYSLFEGECL